MTDLTPGQLTLVVAVVAATAALLGAFINFLATGRSKYVETIARERIKWVGEIRSDFVCFLTDLAKVEKSAHGASKIKDYDEVIDRLRERQQLILLKLNRRSALDQEIAVLMQQCIFASVKNEGDKPIDARVLLRTIVTDLLKEEWETAKWESSGFLQKPKIWWRRRQRQKEYKERWSKSPPRFASKEEIKALEDRFLNASKSEKSEDK